MASHTSDRHLRDDRCRRASDKLTLLVTIELSSTFVFARTIVSERVLTVYSDPTGHEQGCHYETAAQTTAFFEGADGMGIPNVTVVQLVSEGSDSVDYLAGVDTVTSEQIAANLCHPAGRVPDSNPGAATGATIATPPFVFGAELVRYYDTVGRNTTAGNLQWTTTMKNFSE